MAAIAVTTLAQTGTAEAAKTAVSAGGDTVVNDGLVILRIENAHATDPRTVTVDSIVQCNQGADHNLAVVVPALTTVEAGPFPANRFGNPLSLTYSNAGADLSIRPVRVA